MAGLFLNVSDLRVWLIMCGFGKHAEQTLQSDEYLPMALPTDVSVAETRTTLSDGSSFCRELPTELSVGIRSHYRRLICR